MYEKFERMKKVCAVRHKPTPTNPLDIRLIETISLIEVEWNVENVSSAIKFSDYISTERIRVCVWSSTMSMDEKYLKDILQQKTKIWKSRNENCSEKFLQKIPQLQSI